MVDLKNLGFVARFRRGMRRYLGDRRGNISTMVALLIIPLVGVLGLATETGSWYMIHRSAQNAADSAVVAAAQNGLINPGGTTYITEGRQVASNLGFVNGVNSTTVTPVNNQACPAPLTGSNCYKVTVSRNVPVNMVKVLGYNGTGGSGSQTISASAIAGPKDVITQYCILTLGTSGQGIRINGGPNVNFTGCSLMSNSTSNNATNCNGQNPGAYIVAAVGTADSNCGSVAYSGATAIADPYSHYAADNTSDTNYTCSPPTTTQDLSSLISGSTNKKCYSQKLTANISVTSNTVLVIRDGQLNLNGFTLSTTSGAGLTIVFVTSSGQANIAPFVETSGTMDFAAPTSGNWSGVALYQTRENGSTATVSQEYKGNQPTWDITGLVYVPYVDLTFKGIVNKSSLGHTCFALVANSLLISGNGAIYDNPMSQCTQAGLVLPNNIVSSRVTLVQ